MSRRPASNSGIGTRCRGGPGRSRRGCAKHSVPARDPGRSGRRAPLVRVRGASLSSLRAARQARTRESSSAHCAEHAKGQVRDVGRHFHRSSGTSNSRAGPTSRLDDRRQASSGRRPIASRQPILRRTWNRGLRRRGSPRASRPALSRPLAAAGSNWAALLPSLLCPVKRTIKEVGWVIHARGGEPAPGRSRQRRQPARLRPPVTRGSTVRDAPSWRRGCRCTPVWSGEGIRCSTYRS